MGVLPLCLVGRCGSSLPARSNHLVVGLSSPTAVPAKTIDLVRATLGGTSSTGLAILDDSPEAVTP